VKLSNSPVSIIKNGALKLLFGGKHRRELGNFENIYISLLGDNLRRLPRFEKVLEVRQCENALFASL